MTYRPLGGAYHWENLLKHCIYVYIIIYIIIYSHTKIFLTIREFRNVQQANFEQVFVERKILLSHEF